MANTSELVAFGTSTFSRIAHLRDILATRFAQHKAYRETLNELESLSKRELDDLGLSTLNLRAVAREAAYGA